MLMKAIYIGLGIIVCLGVAGCGNRNVQNAQVKALKKQVRDLKETNASLQVQVAAQKQELEKVEFCRSILNDRRIGIWRMKEEKNHWRPVLVKTFNPDKVTPALLVKELSISDPKYGPTLTLTSVKDGIAFVKASDSWPFGSTGIVQHISDITLTLTSLPDIDHVYLYGFGESDHVSPGCPSRADVLRMSETWY
jgi:hypothetical protein